jgi:peptide/nickel transport system permease protein
LRRLLLLIPTVLGVVTLVFLFIHFIPGDPVEIILGENALSTDKAALRAQLRLDEPIGSQYVFFMEDLFKGDLGKSIYTGQSVISKIGERLPATVELTIAAMIIAILISFPLGILAASKRGSPVDTGSMFLALLGVSIPSFWLGPLLILLFAIHFQLLPVSERTGFLSLILPAVTLGTGMAAILSRMLRSSLVEVLSAEYIKTARAKGLSRFLVIGKHALRNALLPVVTIFGLQIGALLSGAIITEKIFDWPGLGSLTIEAIQQRDYPVIQGCVLVIAMIYVLVNILTDLTYSFVDPRIRYE